MMSLSRKMLASLTAIMLMMALFATKTMAATGGVDWERGVIRAIGIGAGKSTTKNKGLKRAQARRAAMMDAQRNLAEAVKGVRVTSNSSIRDLELENDRVTTQIDVIIKNMTEIDGHYNDAEEIYEVILEMPLFGSAEALSNAAFIPFKDEPKVSFPQPVNASVVSNNYTGLIIVCSGMEINCVMSPVIKNGNGQEIYGHMNLTYDKIIVQGMASYANSTNDQISQSRAGNNPLVVKAIRLDDLNANPVVSVEDADKILAANQHDGFLDKCAVVFVK